ncbi:MAG: hypothetical protein GPJ51_12390 [Candidatus Heimdallarchaeota archaeon]|nr:hypothetical protein [Candidatus Heimdallarchaeota archaeon]
MSEYLDEIRLERKKQDEKWGEQNHSPITWIVILTEEVGEAAKEALEDNKRKYRKELVQCGAVCVAAIESLDRNDKNE